MPNYLKSLISIAGLGLLLAPLVFVPQGPDFSSLVTQAYLVVLGLVGILGLAGVWMLDETPRLGKFNFATWGIITFLVLFLITSVGAGTFLDPVKSYEVLERGTGAEVLILSILAFVLASFLNKTDWRRFLTGLFSLSSVVAAGALLALGRVSFFPRLFLGEEGLLMSINQAGIFAGLGLVLGLALLRGGSDYFPEISSFAERNLIRGGALVSFALMITIGTRFIIIPALVGVTALVIMKLVKNKEVLPKVLLGVMILLLILSWGGSDFRVRWTSIPSEPDLTAEAAYQMAEKAGEAQGLTTYSFGGGWGSYKFLYQKYKPAQISATSWWETDFSEGPSEFWTFLTEKGLLGTFGFLVLAIGLLISIVKTELKLKSSKLSTLFLPIAASTLYLLAVFFCYPFSLGLWALFLGCAAGVGGFATLGKEATEFSWDLPVRVLASLLVLILVGYLGIYPARKAVAGYFVDRAEQSSSFNKQMELYEQARKVLPDHPRPLMEQAQRVFDEVIKLQEESEEDQELKQQLNQRLGLALKMGDRAVKAEPRDIQLPFKMADMYLQTSQIVSDPELATEQALDYLNQARELSPASPQPPYRAAQAWFSIARRKRAQGKDEEKALNKVEQNLNETLEKSPGFPLARKSKVELAYFRGNHSETIELGEKFLQDYPRQSSIRQYVAESYYTLGKVEKARKQTDAILEYNHAYLPALKLAGKISARGGDFTKAVDYFERARAKDSDDPELPKILGQLRQDKNPFAEEATSTATSTEGSE